MSKLLTCPHGHQWEAPADEHGSAVGDGCPICARQAHAPGGTSQDTTPAAAGPSWGTVPPTRETSTAAGPTPAMGETSSPSAESLRRWPHIPGYEILEEVGKGGMGVVYKARQVKLNRVVALKMVRGAAHADQEAFLRFLHEAEMAARLQHACFVQVHEVGVHDGCPFFSMEYIDGGNLARSLQRGPVAPRQAAVWLEALARAMHHAHQQGIVHRDLKPANVLLTAEGALKVTDFGLAKHLAVEGGLTQTGAVMGTPAYMAPEQAGGRGKEAGPAADVYSLGTILYEMLAGRPPFGGDRDVDVLVEVVSREPPAPSRLRRGVPQDLETICLKCLEKEPQRRYANAQELADDLGRYLRDEPIRARRSSLVRRGVKWARRRPATAGFLALAVLLLAGGAGLGVWYWDRYERVRIEYFANWVYRRGVPEGVGRLTEEQVRHRYVTWKQYTRGGRIEKQELVDGRGRVTTRRQGTTIVGNLVGAGNQKHVCRYEFQYDAQGRVTEQIGRDKAGNLVWNFHYDTPDTGHFSDKNGYVRGRAGSGAAYVEFTWSPEGYLQATRYCDSSHKPQPNDDGSFGQRFELDDRGQIVRATWLGPDGQPSPCKEAFPVAVAAYDALGNITERHFEDAGGRRVLCKDGYHKVIIRHDAHGNDVEVAYFGLDGNPALHRNGNARITIGHDDQGNLISLAAFGQDGRPVLVPNGFTRLEYTYDAEGNVQECTYFGLDDRPALCSKGHATVRNRHDDRGNILEERYFDREGRPALTPEGFVGWTAEYDAEDRVTAKTYLGADGQPALCKDGYARIASRYDANGNEVERAFLDAGGRPTLCKEGYARQTNRHDDHGNQLEEAYFGTDGRPASHLEGYARRTRAYDSHGNRTEEAYFDAGGKPTPCRKGYSRMTVRYDERGRPVEESYFNRRNEPTSCKEGFARKTTVYDNSNHVLEFQYFGPDGKPTLRVEGYARVVYRNDERGNHLEETRFDEHGALAVAKDGYARVTSVFDARGHRIEAAYFDAENRPVRNKHGIARFQAKFDAQGRQVDIVFFGPDGKRASHTDGNSRRVDVYDERGNKTEEAYYDTEDRPVQIKGGVARWKARYDARGNAIEKAYCDAEGRLVFSRTNGFAREVNDYDERGNVVKKTYYDPRGNLWVVPTLHHAGWTARYDERGNPVEKVFFDAKGLPPAGVARELWKYDDRGHFIEVKYLDANGHLVLNPEKLARQTAEYDERGNRIARAYFDQDDKPTPDWCRESLQYDERGNVVEMLYLGADGKPVMTSKRYAGLRAKYDGRGNYTERTCLDEHLKPLPGWCREVVAYDNRGNPVAFRCFDAEDRPALFERGYASVSRTYNDSDECIDMAYFGLDGKPLVVRLVVTQVNLYGQAARLGLQVGDVLESYDGKPVTNLARFIHTRDGERPGERERELVVVRKGKRLPPVLVKPGKMGVTLEDEVVPVPAQGP